VSRRDALTAADAQEGEFHETSRFAHCATIACAHSLGQHNEGGSVSPNLRILNPLVFLVLCALLAPRASARPDLVPSYLPANMQVQMTLCDTAASSPPNNQYPHYFHLAFVPQPQFTGHSYTPAATPGVNGAIDGDTVSLAAGTQCQAITLTTTGVTDANGYGVNMSSCFDFRSTGGARTCSPPMGSYTFLASITPSIGINPSSPITVGSSRAETLTLNPNFATLTVQPSCTQQNGAVIVVSPQSTNSNITNDSGQAFFNIQTSIDIPIPGQAPSGTCSFTVPLASNGASASVSIQGTVFQPTLTINPHTLSVPGPAQVTATISPAYRGVSIGASCTATGGMTVNVSPSSQATNLSGQAVFSVNPQNMVGVGNTPTASCTFSVTGGTGRDTLSFATGNACTFGLQPAPPACGNP